jgi:hypothetical protein
MTGSRSRRRWRQPPERDEFGRLSPEVLAAARRRVRRALLAVIVVAIAAGLLAYGCSRSAQRPHKAQNPTATLQVMSQAPMREG